MKHTRFAHHSGIRPACVVLLLLATAFAGRWAVAQGATQEAGADRPNVVFLLTDDQRADALGYAGNALIQTPNLDALARRGVSFKNAYVTTSICAVSRASILSGQYARRHGIHGFATSFSARALRQTYPMRLKDAGYRVGFIGKWGVGNAPPDSVFDYWRGFPGQGRYEHTDSLGRPLHLTRLMGRQATEFIRQSAEGGTAQPFALSVSFKAPHVQDRDPRQFIYDPAYEALYADVSIPVPATAEPAYWEAHPDFFKASNEARERWKIRFSTPEQYQQSVKGYYRLITGVDRVVGEIVAELERLGLAGNTLIFFTSDNGFYLGEHGLAGKWYGHEESIRVPMLLFDPALPPSERGQVVDEIALNIDVAPTLLDRAGLPVPAEMQGRSLVPLYMGRPPDVWRRDFFYEHLFERKASAPAIPRSEGIAGGRYKYLRYLDPDPPHEVLYDLEADPRETVNRADDPTYHSVLTRMRDRWAYLREKLK